MKKIIIIFFFLCYSKISIWELRSERNHPIKILDYSKPFRYSGLCKLHKYKLNVNQEIFETFLESNGIIFLFKEDKPDEWERLQVM